jgi:hypothetical protein
VWIGVYLYREYRRGRVFDPAIDDAFEVAGEESSDEPGSQRSARVSSRADLPKTAAGRNRPLQ